MFPFILQADERSNLLSGEVKSLQDEMDSLQLKMNEAENNFRSTLCDYQSELEKEKASHKNTEIVLSDTCKTFDQVKTELENCAQKCLKVPRSLKAPRSKSNSRYNYVHFVLISDVSCLVDRRILSNIRQGQRSTRRGIQ